MYFQKYAKRTLDRPDVSAEFYAFPQKYVVGISQDNEPVDKWKATVSTMLEFMSDEDRNKPSLGLFTQQSMTPFIEQLKTAAPTLSCIVDDAVRINAEFHAKSGIRATVERIATGKPCEYCSKLEGRYTYPDVPEDVYRRHRSCRCIVSYFPGDGRRQNVHTKKWVDPAELEKIERRKSVGLTDVDIKKRVQAKIAKIEKGESDKLIAKDLIKSQRKKISSLVDINNKEVYNKAVSGKRHKGVYVDAVKKTDNQLEKSIKSHIKQVEFHQKKINNPDKYVEGWDTLTHKEKAGNIKKWEKDKIRNAEAAEIEIMVKEKKINERK
ncbi:MAG: hypothetical protein RR495_06550 [Anaerovoracaceae bacterium]